MLGRRSEGSMVRRASYLRGRRDRRDYPLSHGRELSWVGERPGLADNSSSVLRRSSQTCFSVNAPDDRPVADSSLGSKFLGLRRPIEF